MGIWYGIEVISHRDQQHLVRTSISCPIIHISEFKDHYYTPNHENRDNYNRDRSGYRPSYTTKPYRGYAGTQDANRDYNRDYTRDYNARDYNNRDYTRDYNNRDYNRDYKQENGQWNGGVYAPNYSGDPYNQNNYLQSQLHHWKKIKIMWDEAGVSTEYILKYNITAPGFWISSGPQNGSLLDPKYSHFAGTVQVIKAVGNHLVLTFCHTMPEQQLFSILLARENRLDSVDVHGVHALLNRRGLSTNSIKKVCNSSGVRVHYAIASLVVSYLLCRMFR